MNEKEFKKLKAGDKVRIVKEKTGPSWNIAGKMDKWLGKVMTVKDIMRMGIQMVEDQGEHWFGCGWCWTPEMIAEKVEEYPTIVEHLIKYRKTIVKLSNGKVGVAKCAPEDEFDFYEGLRLATARAYGKEPPYKKADKVKEVKRKAKIGEYIKIVEPYNTFGAYKKRRYFGGNRVQCHGNPR